MHRFRTHTCGALRPSDVGATVRLSGWVHRVRDHGHLVFVDLRDHYGITQCVAEAGEPLFDTVTALKAETVATVTGPVVTRDAETVNPRIPTGHVEVRIAALTVQNAAETLPLPVHGEQDYGEEVPAALPLPRPPARAHAPQHGTPQRHRRQASAGAWSSWASWSATRRS